MTSYFINDPVLFMSLKDMELSCHVCYNIVSFCLCCLLRHSNSLFTDYIGCFITVTNV